ncbi:MAG: hemolysin family protein, partial [Verrucomicrobiota bacterium]
MLILLLLIVFNGLFAMAEIAVVSSRRARLRQRADAGDARARLALELAESPNRFLSTVQIGITLVGIGTGAMGEASFARRLAPWIAEVPPLAPYASQIAFGLVVVLLGYLSLVIGELVPKQVGLGNPEGLAVLVARPMQWLSRVAGPFVSFLSASAGTLLRLVGHRPPASAAVTEEEVRTLMQEGVRAGAFNKVESHIIDNALALDQLPVREI